MKTIFSVVIISVFLFTSSFSQTIATTRTVDWTKAGSPEPEYGLMSAVSAVANGLSTTDPSVNVSAIQNSIAALGPSGGIILIPAGTYTFTGTVSIPSNIYILGSGASSCKLIFDAATNRNGFLFKGTVQSTTYDISAGIVEGDNAITLTNASAISPGDWIQIFQDDASLVTSTWAIGTVGQICQVQSVSGNTLTLEEEMRLSIGTDKNPYIKKIDPVMNSGISCVSIERQDGETIGTTSNIRFDRAVNCMVENVSSKFCKYSHVEARYSSHITVRNSYFEQSFDYGGGGNGYGVMLHLTTGDCLVENNIFKMLRHSMIVQAGANGNVFTYNYSREPNRTEYPSDASGDMVCHGNYTYANLFEQNVCQNIAVDDSHGANGPYNTFFRNQANNYGIVVTDPDGQSQNFVGNEVTATTGLASLFNYTIPTGKDHFTYGNYNKGTLTPAGTSSLPEESYFYSTAPPGWSAYYASIGPPNTYNTGTNDAESRYLAGLITPQCSYFLPLQIVLKNFQISSENGQVLVSWNTSYEEEVDRFAVEKYVDKTWQLIKEVDGGSQDYTVIDDSPINGNNIYRLLAKGSDGEYLEVRVDSIEVNLTSIKSVSSDQVRNENGIIYLAQACETIEIIDAQGRILHQTNNQRQGRVFDLNTLSTGIYLVRILWGDHSTSVNKYYR